MTGETVRLLSGVELGRVNGGMDDKSRGACTTAATNGDGGCLSEATGCPSICEWSCINQSCTVATDPAGQ